MPRTLLCAQLGAYATTGCVRASRRGGGGRRRETVEAGGAPRPRVADAGGVRETLDEVPERCPDAVTGERSCGDHDARDGEPFLAELEELIPDGGER